MSKRVDEIIEQKLKAIKEEKNINSRGRVSGVNNYVLEIEGLDEAFYFEEVRIEEKATGYVSKITANRVYVALVRKTDDVYVGDSVFATGKEFCGHYSKNAIGHMVDMFGTECLMNSKFDDTMELKLEENPIPIIDRSKVSRPLATGITGIDMIYPVGKGQRQLIIGDKRSGKTQITMDTIVNQKGKDMLCIYVAVGKTKKEVKSTYLELLKRGAMEYTVILSAFNDEYPPVIRNTPFLAMSIARYYMLNEQKDVLVVIDDLKRHADVCREIGLLTGTVPGRDAYPSDIFYTHARMLENGCQHKDGGSVTVLPIIETKGGDITDYISSNVISITDGQIVLSGKNFEKGFKPAIDYGLSVSRLGGAVQTRDMKRVGAAVRRELLSYLEKCDVYELANADEMSPDLLRTMKNGKKIRENLKQNKYSPLLPEEMQNLFDGLVNLD
ncbi:MAG: hypothetical protein MJ113_02565 [Lachnospiraceae bacterium]|nr:hypothetical protein [Lachnospiraceae bacterium]